MELSDAEKAEIQKYKEKEADDKALEKKQEEEENYQKYKAQRAQKEKEAKAKKAEKVEPKVKTDSEIAKTKVDVGEIVVAKKEEVKQPEKPSADLIKLAAGNLGAGETVNSDDTVLQNFAKPAKSPPSADT